VFIRPENKHSKISAAIPASSTVIPASEPESLPLPIAGQARNDGECELATAVMFSDVQLACAMHRRVLLNTPNCDKIDMH